MDNTYSHGPGGQPHIIREEGDSCFGKISDNSKENVGKIFQQPTFATLNLVKD